MSSTPPQVYPSVDWLTMTVGPEGNPDEAYDKARALVAEQVTRGDDLKPWTANGFRGWRSPHIRTGRRNAEVVVELSGELADRHWRNFYAAATNVSRLDTCVTVTFPNETRNVARDGRDAPRTRPRPGFPSIRKVLWEQVDGGQTLYLGSPKSDRFARLYDKTAESGGEWPENSWRWELQERRHLGSARARLLNSADDVHRAIRAGVHGFFSYHGIFPWFHADGPAVFAPARRSRSDMSRRLDYYARCIAPGVRSGIDRGFGPAILAALGLDRAELEQLAGQLAGQVDDPEQTSEAHIKESDPCLPRRSPIDLTPPRPAHAALASRLADQTGCKVSAPATSAETRWPGSGSAST